MTVGSQVKGCYASVKNIEATLGMLKNKAQTKEAREVFHQAEQLMSEVKTDLSRQVIKISKEEPQYKSF